MLYIACIVHSLRCIIQSLPTALAIICYAAAPDAFLPRSHGGRRLWIMDYGGDRQTQIGLLSKPKGVSGRDEDVGFLDRGWVEKVAVPHFPNDSVLGNRKEGRWIIRDNGSHYGTGLFHHPRLQPAWGRILGSDHKARQG